MANSSALSSLRKLVEKHIKNPTTPVPIEETDFRFPHVVVPEAEIEQGVTQARHVGFQGNTFYNQQYETQGQKDFARWSDHRQLLKRRSSPKKMPEDVPAYIMDAVEDTRAALLVKRTGLSYKSGGDAAALKFFNQYGYGDRIQNRYYPSHGVYEEGKWRKKTQKEKDEEAAKRLAQETMGILTALPYVFSPGRTQVRRRVERTFHPRMLNILNAIEAAFTESDLSFKDAHYIGRLLHDLLRDLPAPPTPPPAMPPIPVTVPEGGGAPAPKKKGEGPPPPRGKGKGAGPQEESGFDEGDTVDWSKYRPQRNYAPQVSAQLTRIAQRSFHDYGSMYTGSGSRYFSDYQVERTSEARKGDRGNQGGLCGGIGGETAWDPMVIDKPKLTHQTVRPKDVGRGYRHTAHESGRVPRNMHRFATDQRVFSRKRHKKGGIALMCDVSGSMHLSVNDVDRILDVVPASVIACYSGSGGVGGMRVIAKDGRRVDRKLVGSGYGGGNGVDLPALRWLVKQQAGGRYWLSDGLVTGQNENIGWQLFKDVDDFCVLHDIYQVQTVEELLKVIFEGQPLKERTMRTHAETYYGESW
jgi:hypothetical protein